MNDLEEERRLLYVATSRAKEKLIILNVINKKSLLNNINDNLYNKYIIN